MAEQSASERTPGAAPDPDVKALASELEAGRGCQLKKLLDGMPSLEERLKTLRAIAQQNKEQASAAAGKEQVPRLTLHEYEDTYFAVARLTLNDGAVLEGATLYQETLNWSTLKRSAKCK